MSENATKLCQLLVEENYGELPAKIFETLMKHGRLRFSTINEHSQLSPRQVRHGLAILIQQNLVLWATDEQYETTHYEADWRNAYALIRYGKLLKAVDSRFGEATGSLLSDFLLAGHIRVRDLRQARGLAGGTPTKEVNGASSDREAVETDKDFDSALQNLLQDQFVCMGNKAQFCPEADNYDRAELRVRRDPKYADKIKKKDEPAFRTAIDDLVRSRLEGPPLFRIPIADRKVLDPSRQRKRRFVDEDDNSDSDADDDEQHLHRKQRLVNGEAKVNGYPRNNEKFGKYCHDGIPLRVNNQKAAVAARSDWLVKLVQECIGPATATVYYTILRLLEPDIHQCCGRKRNVEAQPTDELEEQPRVTTRAIVAKIVDFDPLKAALNSSESRRRKSGPHNLSSGSDMEIDDEADSADHDTSIVHEHLRLLINSKTPWLNRHLRAGSQSESWSVPFESLSKQLRIEVLKHSILSQYGHIGHRLASILQEFGKMDDQSVLRRVFIEVKQCRALLSKMAKSGKLEVQEVPRDNNRVPSRTVWLWYFDADRCGLKVLDETYQAMLRCLQRLKHERDLRKDTLIKAARTDVVGREEEYLSKGELAELNEWRAKEEALLAELGRLDNTVLVLRDMQGI